MFKGVPEQPDVHTCQCGKECASYTEFKAHLSSHIHSQLPNQGGHANSHGPGHSKERKWKCSICPQAFISPSKLHVHFMGHMGMKPHKCDFCSKAFSDPSNLRTHLKIHTGKYRLERETDITFDYSWVRGTAKQALYQCLHCKVEFSLTPILSLPIQVNSTSWTAEAKFKSVNCLHFVPKSLVLYILFWTENLFHILILGRPWAGPLYTSNKFFL